MKSFLPCLLLGLLAVPAEAAEPDDQLPPAPQGKSFKLVWNDEFDGDKLDETKWDVPNNRRRDGWYPLKKDAGIWNVANKNFDATTIVAWSPLVKQPVAVRYAWARSPMGNLKLNGKTWLPLPSFRTDEWDWPESEDPAESLVDRGKNRAMQQEAAERLETRKMEEAERAVEILKQLEMLGKNDPATRQ